MWKFYKPEYINRHIDKNFFLARWLGFFNLTYDERARKFKKSRILSVYSSAMLTASCLLNVKAFVYVWSCPIIQTSDEPAEAQGKILYAVNAFQLIFGITTTYINQTMNQNVLCHILNGLVKCNRRLLRLVKSDVIFPVKNYRDLGKVRVLIAILDICLAMRQDIYLQATEYRIVLFVNILILLGLFFEWSFVQHQLTNTYEILNQFVSNNSKYSSLTDKDFRSISKICSRVCRLQGKSRRYFKQFAIMTYLSLIRTVAMSYLGFTLLLFAFNKVLLSALVYLLQKVLIYGLAPAIQIMMLGSIAECLLTEANNFRWNLLMSECKCRRKPAVQQVVELVIIQEQWEDISWSALPGVTINRSYSFDMMMEVISWSLVMITYDAGKLKNSLFSFTGTHEDELLTRERSLNFMWYVAVLLFVCRQISTMLESARKVFYFFLYVCAWFLFLFFCKWYNDNFIDD